jgi:eukaryotic-like serine/threonine-protein kinase
MELPSPDRWRRIATLFAEAVDVPPSERTAFLEDRIEDASLRAELARLLLAHDRADGFLDELDTGRAAGLIREAEDGVEPGESIGPYRVVRRLGHGGMGVVWLAHDPRLDRRVALKLLPAHRSTDDAARRSLTEEAKAASALDHPHIATIYDIGDAPDGRVFIAMAFYEGESLRDRLERGRLSVEETLAVATPLADALAAAHAAGIVHRDVKPGNVILTPSGGVKLVDFGVAKLPATPAPTSPMAGTPPYMSPEQVRGEEVDGRADIWSLGVVLYEMLSGRRPFGGADEAALLRAIQKENPTEIRRLSPEVPAPLARIVERCLARSPSARFASASELRDALRAMSGTGTARRRRRLRGAALALALTVGLAAGVRLLVGGGATVPPSTFSGSTADVAPGVAAAGPTRLAVLPFANLGTDPQDEYFAEGLTDELISRLAGLSQLRVIARTSVLRYQGTDRSIPAIAAELGVARVLEGGIRRVDDRVRITVQLVDASTQEAVWSEAYDAELEDVLGVQRDIAERVAAALELRLEPGDRQTLAGTDAVDPDAYLLYLRGRHFLNRRTEQTLHQAVESFQDAIRRDTSFAAAYASLAQAYMHLGNYGFARAEQVFPQARRAAERALGLPGAPAEAHAVLALLYVAERDFASAEQAFLRALDLRPNDATARHLYGFFLGIRDRTAEALREVRFAQELDPLALPITSSLARLLTYAEETGEAFEQLDAAIRLEPAYPWTWFGLALAHTQRNAHDEAIRTAERALELAPGQPRVRATVVALRARAGDDAPARQLLSELEAAPDSDAYAYELALIHAALNDPDRAFARLSRTRWSSETLFSLRTDPLLATLRSDRRYARLLRTLGMEI